MSRNEPPPGQPCPTQPRAHSGAIAELTVARQTQTRFIRTRPSVDRIGTGPSPQEARHFAGLSQQEAARRLGVAQATLAQAESAPRRSFAHPHGRRIERRYASERPLLCGQAPGHVPSRWRLLQVTSRRGVSDTLFDRGKWAAKVGTLGGLLSNKEPETKTAHYPCDGLKLRVPRVRKRPIEMLTI